MKRRTGILTLAAAALLAAPAQAYYHYTHFLTGFTPVYEKYDLAALPDKTVTVRVSNEGPNDPARFASVLAQVRQAVAVWNGVASSDIRVVFGGVESPNQVSNTPGIDVIFTGELPDGVLADAAPVIADKATPATGPDGKFFPIVRSVLRLNANLDVPPGPTYAEGYFLTVLHELGHTLGLQHTFTSSAMSTEETRDTNRVRSLDPDDVAALSILYGKSGWRSAYGSISGKVTLSGQAVALASVVALPEVGSPVSALTNPDGSYTIDGVPPGSYLLYVHPLPPDADVRAPVDATWKSYPAGKLFGTVFYPATRDVASAAWVQVKAANSVTGMDFSVQSRTALPIYSVAAFSYYDPAAQTYSPYGTRAVTPAFIDPTQSKTKGMATITFKSVATSTATPDSAAVLGGFSGYVMRAYGNPSAVALYFNMPDKAAPGPRHLILNYANDMYVLPNGVNVAAQNPPAISNVTDNGDGSVTLRGYSFDAGTRIYFEGLPAAVKTPSSGAADDGSVTVIAPPGFGGQTAALVAYNADGQNSLTLETGRLIDGLPPLVPAPTYTYPDAEQPLFSATPARLPAGGLAKIEINASNLNLASGDVTLGFGTSDVSVRKMWAISPTKLIANVAVASNAALGVYNLNLISGFQTAAQPFGFETAAAGTAPRIAAVTNGIPTQATLYPGGYVSLYGFNLASSLGDTRVTLNDKQVPVAYSSAGQVNIVVPGDIPTGPLTLRLQSGTGEATEIVAQIDAPPPVIAGVAFASGGALSSNRPAMEGDGLLLTVKGLDDGVAANPDRLRVTLAGAAVPVSQIASKDGVGQIAVTLPRPAASGWAQLTVWVDGSASAPVPIPVL
jgi:uncharacterized protein (TIGR03437 family)